MPSVAMNGVIFIFVTMMPLIKPTAAPVSMPQIIPIHAGIPHQFMNTPSITLTKVIDVPIDTSMPPVTTT